jgi:hypothetical protein
VLTAHQIVALAAMAVCALAALLGGATYYRGRDPGILGRQLLALAQTVLIAQVALGLLLLSEGRRSQDDLHYAYGVLSLAVVLAPWFYAPEQPRRRLVWFAGATLIAALLAGRAYMTAG